MLQHVLARRVDTSGVAKPLVVFNSLSWPRTEWLRIGDGWQKVSVPAHGPCGC